MSMIENEYSLEKLYEMGNEGAEFTIADGEIVGVVYGRDSEED